MPWLPDLPAVASATFTVLDGAGAGAAPFELQFNPASLDYTVSNEFDDRSGANGARQFVKKSSAKLTMSLVFDTTTTGNSVRDVTAAIAALLEPARNGSRSFAPKVEFGWGSYSFQGVVEQFKETLDFFSASGVPLRSSINLTLASQQVEFQSSRSPAPRADREPRADPVQLPPGASAADAARSAGDPRASRAIAGASGAASLRFSAGVSLSVGASVSLGAAADFSVAVGGGVGRASGGGSGLGMGGATTITTTAGAAFAGLRVSPAMASVSVVEARAALLPAALATGMAGAAGVAGVSGFGPGGRAQLRSGASLAADVGSQATLRGRIQFGD
jgi:hypothetical protein